MLSALSLGILGLRAPPPGGAWGPGPTVMVALPVMPLTVSVAVSVWSPDVRSVAVKVCVPLSLVWNV